MNGFAGFSAHLVVVLHVARAVKRGARVILPPLGGVAQDLVRLRNVLRSITWYSDVGGGSG